MPQNGFCDSSRLLGSVMTAWVHCLCGRCCSKLILVVSGRGQPARLPGILRGEHMSHSLNSYIGGFIQEYNRGY